MIIAIAIGVPLVITLGILVANRKKGADGPADGNGPGGNNSGPTPTSNQAPQLSANSSRNGGGDASGAKQG